MTKYYQHQQRGLSSLEVAMVMPLIVLFTVMAIGIGETLIVRQHSVIAARYAATRHSLDNDSPADGQVSTAVSDGREKWSLTPDTKSAAHILAAMTGGIPSGIGSALLLFINHAGRRGEISYEARSLPIRGIFARLFTLNEATGKHRIPTGTWNCRQGGGILSAIGEKVKVPGLKIPSELPCCRSYEPHER
jgi:hypothetical protein